MIKRFSNPSDCFFFGELLVEIFLRVPLGLELIGAHTGGTDGLVFPQFSRLISLQPMVFAPPHFNQWYSHHPTFNQ
jgi:hypothetical protein